jgi:hypothetical protein
MHQVTVRQALHTDPVNVINAIWSGAEWNARWEPIARFDVQYDDGLHQIADITLDWQGTETQMTVVRFRTRPICIEFFCPRPPHPLVHQSGRWMIESENGKNFVVAERRIALAKTAHEAETDQELRLDSYADRLSTRLALILPRFACNSAISP